MIAPKLGYYRAECCLLDLYRIDTEEDLEDALDRVSFNDEAGQLMVFATLADAVAALRDELDHDTERRELARLGWIEPDNNLPEPIQK